jgi:choloylglycine hydrolase
MKWANVFLVVIAVFGKASVSRSCSAIVLKNDQSVYLAKNFDWTYGNGYVKNLRNTAKRAFTGFTNNPVTWISRYGSISFNQNGKEMLYGGINEKGLAVEKLNGELVLK